MISVPNEDRAEIDRLKLTDYLLASFHPVGKAKARFFASLGFGSTGAAEELDRALRELLRQPEGITSQESEFGTKYIVDGTLRGATASAQVRSIWIVERGMENPRFVTAYPRRLP